MARKQPTDNNDDLIVAHGNKEVISCNWVQASWCAKGKERSEDMVRT
jgi:hypothetical protein